MRSPRTTRQLGGALALATLSATLVAGTAVSGASAATQAPTAGATDVVRPLVVGHRGASGYRPEHTLAAYELAIAMGADIVEPDVVSTKDGVLVARHENEISTTTDVSTRAEFADRRATRSIDGVELTGWFTEDFTLAELKTLRAKERLPAVRQENTLYDGRYEVPTVQEVVELVERESQARGRTIGIIPETKHPTYFDSIGLSLEEPLVELLEASTYDSAADEVYIQSFEVANLRDLNRLTDIRLVQLLGGSGQPYDYTVAGDKRTYDNLASPSGLRRIGRYADVLGPNKERVIRPVGGVLGAPTSLVDDAHANGLLVVPYTFRNENAFLPDSLDRGTDPTAYGNAFAEYAAHFAAGVDGVFSDNPDTAVEAREDFLDD